MENLVHAQVCTHTDMDNDISVFLRYLSNLGKNVGEAAFGKCEVNIYWKVQFYVNYQVIIIKSS